MDDEDAVEEGYIMKGEREKKRNREEHIKRERGTVLFLR